MYKILLCDIDLHPLIAKELSAYEVDVATNRDEVYDLTYQNQYDLYIVNFYYNDILSELYEAGDRTTTIFVDEYYNIYNLKKAFSIGDDYMIKPINPQEMKIRVEYHYKKLYKHNQNILIYKDFFFHIKTKQLFQNKSRVKLSPSEAKLLELFLANLHKPMHKDRIFELLNTQSDGTLRVYISKLHKIGFTISYERANRSYTLE